MPPPVPKYPVVLNGTKLEVLQPGCAMPIAAGGTGAETLADAQKNLGVLPEAPPPLNDGTKKFVRKVARVGSNISYSWEELANAATPMRFKGSKDATIAFGRDTPEAGDVWLASVTGLGHVSWVGIGGIQIFKGALLVWDGAEWMVAEIEIPAHVIATSDEILGGLNDQKAISPKGLYDASVEKRKAAYPQLHDIYFADSHHAVRLNSRGLLENDLTLGVFRVPERGVFASHNPDDICWHADGRWRPGDIVVFSDPATSGIVGTTETTTLHPHWGEPALAKATKGDMAIRLSVKSLYVPGHTRITADSSVLNADGTEGRWFFIRTGEDGMPMADEIDVLKGIARDKVISPSAMGRSALSSPNPVYPSASNHYREGAYRYVRLNDDGQLNPGFLLGAFMVTDHLSAADDPDQHEANRRLSGEGPWRPGEVVLISNPNEVAYHANWHEPQNARGKLGDIAVRVPADNIYPNRADGVHGKWLFFRAGLEPATVPRIDITRRNGDTTSVILD